MGNCIKKESSMHWGGEDWSSATSETVLFPKTTAKMSPHHHHHESSYGYGYGKAMNGEEEEHGLIAKKKKLKYCPFGSNTTAATEVKIKITKKQLEELISRADREGLSIQQVLAQLMNVADKFDTHQRSWRPALQSIPEADVN